MKIAVISFSGNVGKTTIARHLLAPRLPSAKVISIESLNADDNEDEVIRGGQFAELQEYLQLADDVIIDIGASNVEELLALMRRYRDSQHDIDCFVVPTVPALKQQFDTVATLVELSRLNVPASKVRLVFNMVEDDTDFERVFQTVLSFVRASPVAQWSPACRIGSNEIYGLIRKGESDLSAIAADTTDFKTLIARTPERGEKIALAQRLAVCRLARGVLPELDACFAALDLAPAAAHA